MPIYEYTCRSCRHEFEVLLLPASTDPPQCPQCDSKDLGQTLSAFAVKTGERSSAAWKAARKKYQRTELRDKQVAEREETEHHLHPEKE